MTSEEDVREIALSLPGTSEELAELLDESWRLRAPKRLAEQADKG